MRHVPFIPDLNGQEKKKVENYGNRLLVKKQK